MKPSEVLGHHSDAASGSDAVYGRELQSAALREYVLILESVADGKFLPDQTRSGNFSPGWSREAIMNAAAVPPPSSPTAPDVPMIKTMLWLWCRMFPTQLRTRLSCLSFGRILLAKFLHRTTLGSAMFLCGRPFGDHYRRIPIARAQTHPQCAKCFPKGGLD